MTIEVRRIRADEWRRVRDLRLESLLDPVAHLAFLETHEGMVDVPDEFWEGRARGGAAGDDVSQWVAVDGDEWVGSLVVIAYHAGARDYRGEAVEGSRASVVGVYVRPSHRGTGVLGLLIDAAAIWTRGLGFAELTLEVHPDNTAAIRAYERCGFAPTGETVDNDGVADIVMTRPIAATGGG